MSLSPTLVQCLEQKYGIRDLAPYRPANKLGFQYFVGTMGPTKVFIKTDGLLGQAAKREAVLLETLQKVSPKHYFPRLVAHESAGGNSFVVTDFIPGVKLSRLIREKEAFDRSSLFLQMEAILKILLKTQVVHRDIRPANLLVTTTDQGELKLSLIDFSYAIRLGRSPLPELDFLRDRKHMLVNLGGEYKPAA